MQPPVAGGAERHEVSRIVRTVLLARCDVVNLEKVRISTPRCPAAVLIARQNGSPHRRRDRGTIALARLRDHRIAFGRPQLRAAQLLRPVLGLDDGLADGLIFLNVNVRVCCTCAPGHRCFGGGQSRQALEQDFLPRRSGLDAPLAVQQLDQCFVARQLLAAGPKDGCCLRRPPHGFARPGARHATNSGCPASRILTTRASAIFASSSRRLDRSAASSQDAIFSALATRTITRAFVQPIRPAKSAVRTAGRPSRSFIKCRYRQIRFAVKPSTSEA